MQVQTSVQDAAPRKRLAPRSAWKKGTSPNPGGKPKVPLYGLSRAQKAELLVEDAFAIAKAEAAIILPALRSRDKNRLKGLRDRTWSWGVAADKVLQGVQPAQVTNNLVLQLFGAMPATGIAKTLGPVIEIPAAVDSRLPLSVSTTTCSQSTGQNERTTTYDSNSSIK